MNRAAYIVAALLFSGTSVTEAQQRTKSPRIGWLTPASPAASVGNLETFLQSLGALGYVDGKNIEMIHRYANGNSERLAEFAAELVRLKVAVIVTSSTEATKTAKRATTEIPIVVATAGDLLGEGIVASLARPGGNVTGLTALSPDLSGKRLELIKETVPKATRFAVIWHRNPNDEKEVEATKVAASRLRVHLQSLPIQTADELQTAYSAMKRDRAGAVIFIQGPFLTLNRQQLFDLAVRNRLPSICDSPAWTDAGCMMSYGPDRREMSGRAAKYVDKILKGANPADLPVEQPKKFELLMNIKTAKQIGLRIPADVLARADRVIR